MPASPPTPIFVPTVPTMPGRKGIASRQKHAILWQYPHMQRRTLLAPEWPAPCVKQLKDVWDYATMEVVCTIDQLSLLQLMQLADSALPIGSTAHSSGLETLVAEATLHVEQLEAFLQDYLKEAGKLESLYCRLAYRLSSLPASPDQKVFETQWLALNQQLSALKTARESRTASATLGRRFLSLAQHLTSNPLLLAAAECAKTTHTDIHYSAAFGLVGGILAVGEVTTTLAYLQQSLTNLVSACQRLMPLGQNRASTIIWQLKPTLIEIARCTEAATLNADNITVFTPILDLASMRHPDLTTRLFIS